MEKIIELMFYSFKNKSYKNLIQVVMIGLVFFSPSFSYIFIYKRDMFYELEFFKLLTLCIILNIIFFIAVYLYHHFIYNLKTENIENEETQRNFKQNDFIKDTEEIISEDVFVETISSVLVIVFLMYFLLILNIYVPLNWISMERVFLIFILVPVIYNSFLFIKRNYKKIKDDLYRKNLVISMFVFVFTLTIIFNNIVTIFIK